MIDCKMALAEIGGDLEKAQEYLRKKGLSTTDKKSSRRENPFIHPQFSERSVDRNEHLRLILSEEVEHSRNW